MVAAHEAYANNLQASLDLSKGPSFQVAYLTGYPDQMARVLIVIHHMMVDGISWRILWQDLTQAYAQAAQGQPITVQPEPVTYKDWGRELNNYGQSIPAQLENDYWQKLYSYASTFTLPVDFRKGENTVASSKDIT